jgi:hypothetical protein
MTDRDRRRRDSAVLDEAIDAAKVTDDFVRGVLENAAGKAGGSDQIDRGWRKYLHLGGRLSGERSVVRGMAGAYAPEQLRKAANAADELVVALEAVAFGWTPAALGVAGRLDGLHLEEIPAILRDPATTAGSPAVRDVHERLSRAVAVMNEARTQAILFEMRQARDQGEHPSG